MATKFCMSCGGEFIATVERCPDCDIELVDEAPIDHLDPELGEDGTPEGQIEYEIHSWALESRVMLEQLLEAAHIPHAWQGADLVVPAAFEGRVDALLAQVESTTLPMLDPDAPKVAYDIDDWTDEQQNLLIQALNEVGIVYEFDVEGAIVVLEENEERVEAIIDGIDDDPDADDDEAAEDDGSGYDGPEAMDVLSDLFVAADRLSHNATSPDGVLAIVDRAVDAEAMPLPFGFERTVWADILEQVTALRTLLESAESDDEGIEEQARLLRDTLRQYV